MDTPRVEPMSRLMAAKTKRHFVCAGCWSELIIVPDKTKSELDLAICPNCNCPGYVSKSYIQRAESRNIESAIEAREALRPSIPWMRLNKSRDQILKDLGF